MQNLISQLSTKTEEWSDGIYDFIIYDNHPYYIGQVIFDDEIVFEIEGSPYETIGDVEKALEQWSFNNAPSHKVYIFDYFIVRSPSVIPSGIKIVVAQSKNEAIKIANIPDYFTVNITIVQTEKSELIYEEFDSD